MCNGIKLVSVLFFALCRITQVNIACIKSPACFLNLPGTFVALPGWVSLHAAGIYREIMFLMYSCKMSISTTVWSHSV